MPVHNAEKYIANALESIKANFATDIEIVLIDNGSSDGTLKIVRSIGRTLPIRVLTPGFLGNWTAPSNLGLLEATGEWACFLHHDDRWLPGRISRLRSEMQRSDTVLILHDAIFIGPEGQGLGAWTCPLPEGRVASKLFIERLLVQNFIAIVSPIFNRKAAVDSGGLDESLWFSADWDLWLRLGAMGTVHFIKETWSAYRIHAASQTASRKVGVDEWRQQLTTVVARHLPRGGSRTGTESKWSAWLWHPSR